MSITNDLREQLFGAIKDLRAGKIEVSQAKVVADLSGRVIDSVRVELDAVRLLQENGHESADGHLAALISSHPAPPAKPALPQPPAKQPPRHSYGLQPRNRPLTPAV